MISAPVLLNTHSYFSILEGTQSPRGLAQLAAASGYECLALTDHNLLSGVVEFTRACQEVNIRPILGLEVDVQGFLPAKPGQTSPPRLVFLAKSDIGWANLSRISSLREATGLPVPFTEIFNHAQGLVCLTGGWDSYFLHALERGLNKPARTALLTFKEVFKDDLYIQVQEPPTPGNLQQAMIELAHGLKIPVTAGPPVFFTNQDTPGLQAVMHAIRTNSRVSGQKDGSGQVSARFLDPSSLENRFAEFPQALIGTMDVAAKCQFQLPLGVPHLPSISLPDSQTPAQVLRERAYQGALRFFGQLTPEITERLEHELTVIGSLGFEPIFLIMEEILSFAREKKILYSSRGSAASSLVAHCLAITSPDPLRLGLYFERFLNPARTTPPDIDTDIDSRRRDEVIEHVFETYGRDRVAMVATINRYRPRSTVTDVGKAFGLSISEIRRLSQELPHSFFAMRDQNDDQPGSLNIPDLLGKQFPQAKYQPVFSLAQQLMGKPRHLSVHPGGLVITPDPMTTLVPVLYSGPKGVTITQFDLESLEYLGVIKIDILGIRGLTVLSDVISAVKGGEESQSMRFSIGLQEELSQDTHTAQILSAGQTIGCFQIESPGMRSTLKQIHAKTPDDVMAALALYRPGPMRGGMRDAFIRRHNREEPVEHLHPALANTLADTYGVILYQEQVLRIAHQIAGLSLSESDLIRRAMSHFDPGKQMQLLKEKFILGAQRVCQIEPDLALQIWEMMAAFAGYGFPKAHAASYSEIAWRSAWCKTHFPAEFIAAVLANWGGYYSQRVYLMEARRMGFKVKPPHINYSQREFSVWTGDWEKILFMGLNQVRELTAKTIGRILHLRPFRSLEDFMIRANPRPAEILNLIRCGGLDELGSIAGLLSEYETVPHLPGQPSLFTTYEPYSGSEIDRAQRVAYQEAALGISVDFHPLDLFAEKIAQLGADTTAEAVNKTGKRVQIVGVRQTHRRTRTERGDMMAFITLEDLEGSVDVILFPDVYQRSPRSIFSHPGPLWVTGTIELDQEGQEPYLRADRVELLVNL